MLGELPSQRRRRQVFRFATLLMSEDLMSEVGLDSRSEDELREFLLSRGYRPQNNRLLDGPFQRKQMLQERSRFSDGLFPVFYTSLDADTAEAEVRHRFLSYSGKPQTPRTWYFQQFSCTFDGVEIDLRPKLQEWPDLVHDSDYSFCNEIGTEAKRLDIDGLVTWSARQQDGVNLPVFARRAVSTPELGSVVAMTYDPGSGGVSVRRVKE